jgi:hypothetical protein
LNSYSYHHKKEQQVATFVACFIGFNIGFSPFSPFDFIAFIIPCFIIASIAYPFVIHLLVIDPFGFHPLVIVPFIIHPLVIILFAIEEFIIQPLVVMEFNFLQLAAMAFIAPLVTNPYSTVQYLIVPSDC